MTEAILPQNLQRTEALVRRAAAQLRRARRHLVRGLDHPDPEVAAFFAADLYEIASGAADNLQIALGWLDDVAASVSGRVLEEPMAADEAMPS